MGLAWTLAMMLATGWLAQVTVTLAVGRRLAERPLVALAIGALMFLVVRANPVVGELVGIVVVLGGLGAVVSALFLAPPHSAPALVATPAEKATLAD